MDSIKLYLLNLGATGVGVCLGMWLSPKIGRWFLNAIDHAQDPPA